MCLIELQPWGNDAVLGRDDNGAHGGHRAWLSPSSPRWLCLDIFVLDSVWKQAAWPRLLSCHVWHQNTGSGERGSRIWAIPTVLLLLLPLESLVSPSAPGEPQYGLGGCRHNHGRICGQYWAVCTCVIHVPEVGAHTCVICVPRGAHTCVLPCALGGHTHLCDPGALGTHTPP